MLLSREDFRKSVFERDKYRCVLCSKSAVDAHHIIDRRLWSDGGYYLDNGASVCEDHHLLCESTDVSTEDLRKACGITKIIIPDHLFPDQPYDKWGNPILENGLRGKGELFNDENVQKILRDHNKLHLFTEYVKYPRTYHLPWSESKTDDDKTLKDVDHFIGKRVIVSEKMDGENTSLYRNYFHARSIDGRNHPSRSMAKSIHARFAHDIPNGWRICVENLYATHSIHYENLKSYIYGISIWDNRNVCLSWDETLTFFSLLDIYPIETIYDGIFDESLIKKLYSINDKNIREGYVIRLADEFHYKNFNKSVAKFVRKNHVQTDSHWMHEQRITPNELER